ncbi:unnamed protein product, partial [Amoebophrya sp. A25]|eukprot:GSA25T00026197001.1
MQHREQQQVQQESRQFQQEHDRALAQNGLQRTEIPPAMKKSRMCSFFEQGRCSRGWRCSFA